MPLQKLESMAKPFAKTWKRANVRSSLGLPLYYLSFFGARLTLLLLGAIVLAWPCLAPSGACWCAALVLSACGC